MSRLQRGKLPGSSPNIYKIREGGTGANTAPQALINLNAVPANLVDKPGGVLSIDANKKLKPDAIAGLSVTGISVDGPTSLTINQVQAYTITDYDSFINYTITAIAGSVSRSGATITYTAPGTTGPSGFIINGKTVTIAIGANIVLAPTITNIVNGATNVGSTINLIGSAFAVSSGSDTHQWSDWQIATDVGFTSIVSQSISDTVNKTSWTSGTLLANTTYYARVRYKGTTYSFSNWGSVISFTTKTSFAPTIEQAVITAPDKAAQDRLGGSISVDATGTRCVIGASSADVTYTDSGAVYVFTKTGVTWSLEQKLSASDKAASDNFGHSVSISADGTRIAIGAYSANVTAVDDSGAVYIFLRTGVTWAQEIKLAASDKVVADYFGYSVSLDSTGTRCVIGAYTANPTSLGDAGKAYVFLRTGVSWAEEQILTASDKAANDYFGYSVAIDSSGVRVIIGAYQADPTSLADAGKAYVFTRSGVTWTQEQILTASDKAVGDNFGISVDIDDSGVRCVVGAYHANPSALTDAGKVYIFTRSGVTWTQEQMLTASDKASGDQFGESVTMSADGSVIAAGSIYAQVGGTSQAGKAYVFTRSGVTWTQLSILSASNKAINCQFGGAVGMSGDNSVLGIGAKMASPSSVTEAGSAYIFT